MVSIYHFCFVVKVLNQSNGHLHRTLKLVGESGQGETILLLELVVSSRDSCAACNCFLVTSLCLDLSNLSCSSFLRLASRTSDSDAVDDEVEGLDLYPLNQDMKSVDFAQHKRH